MMAPTLKKLLPWLVPLMMLLTAVVGVPLLMFDAQGLPRYQALQTELDRLRTENAELEAKVSYLKSDIHALHTDATAIERIARDELGMVHEGEIVFQFDR